MFEKMYIFCHVILSHNIVKYQSTGRLLQFVAERKIGQNKKKTYIGEVVLSVYSTHVLTSPAMCFGSGDKGSKHATCPGIFISERALCLRPPFQLLLTQTPIDILSLHPSTFLL